MIAYPACYLGDAKVHLGTGFDYAVNDCGVGGDLFARLLASSQAGILFASGNPAIVAGMSGIELTQQVLAEGGLLSSTRRKDQGEPSGPHGDSAISRRGSLSASRQYWTGWALAHYQWASSKSFRHIFEAVPYSQVEAMYDVYHEADISLFLRDVDELVKAHDTGRPTRLHQRREAAGLSQSQLAKAAGVGLRSIQMYEQRVNDIDKAQAATLFRMAKTLGCSIEDLLEQPAQTSFEYAIVEI